MASAQNMCVHVSLIPCRYTENCLIILSVSCLTQSQNTQASGKEKRPLIYWERNVLL